MRLPHKVTADLTEPAITRTSTGLILPEGLISLDILDKWDKKRKQLLNEK